MHKPLLALVLIATGSLGSVPARAQVLISEVLATNGSTWTDADGSPSDWIEINNSGQHAVDLEGWYLTDNPTVLNKWPFPSVLIEPGRFLTVFCSGKHRQDSGAELHTNFSLDGNGEYVALVGPDFTVESQISPFFPPQFRDRSFGIPQDVVENVVVAPGSAARFYVPGDGSLGRSWTAVAFDDSDVAGWAPATLGIGYDSRPGDEAVFAEFIETDIATDMKGVNPSAYIRVAFELVDASAYRFLRLTLRYDDGFVAYLNGIRVASGNAPEAASWNSRALRDHSDENSLRVESFNVSKESSALRDGLNVLAIQLLNTSSFNRDCFVQPELTAISAGPPEVGRWKFFDRPSPNFPNGRGFDHVAPDPEFSRAEGVFRESFELALVDPTGRGELRYTLDGSEPVPSSTLYKSPISIVTSTEVRVRLFEPERASSRPITRRYVRLSADASGFGSNLPVFVLHTMGKTIDRSRFTPTLVQLFEPTEGGRTELSGVPTFTGKGALRVRGSSTARPLFAKPPFAFEIRDEEEEDLAVSLLDMPADSDWILYSPFNQDRALIRNALIYELSNQMERYAVRTRFVEMFLRLDEGEIASEHYQGVYLLMEKIKRGRHRVDVEPLRGTDNAEPGVTGGYMFKVDRRGPGSRGFVTARGNPADTDVESFFIFVTPEEEMITAAQRQWIVGHLNEFEDVFFGTDYLDPVKGYAKYLDIGSFMDHHMLVELGKNPDGLRLSTYFHKRRGGKISAGPVWDYDRSMAPTLDGRARDPIGFYQHTGYLWWGRLRQDPVYQARYTARWRELRRGPLGTENVHAIIDDMAAELAESQVRNYERWPETRGELGWEHEIQRLKDWLSTRLLWLDYQWMEAPVIEAESGRVEAPFEVALSNPNGFGEIVYTVNGPDPRTRANAVANEARVYSGPLRLSQNSVIRARVRVDNLAQGGKAWSDSEDGFFITSTTSLAVTELMFDPPGGYNYEFIELQNFGTSELDLAGVGFSDGVSFLFTPEHGALAPGEFVVVVNDLESFAERYQGPGSSEVRVAGEFEGGLRASGEELELHGRVGEPIARFEYSGDWYPEAREGHSLVLKDAASSPEFWSLPVAWRPSALSNGSPGREDVSVQTGSQISGDSNQDGRLDLSDALHLLIRLFRGDGGAWPCGDGTQGHPANQELFDANGDGAIDGSDAVHELEYLFRLGAPPAGGLECRKVVDCPEGCR